MGGVMRRCDGSCQDRAVHVGEAQCWGMLDHVLLLLLQTSHIVHRLMQACLQLFHRSHVERSCDVKKNVWSLAGILVKYLPESET